MGSSSSTNRASNEHQPPLRSWASALPPASDGTISGTLQSPNFILRMNNERGLLGLQPQRPVNHRRPPRKTKANAVKNPVNLHKGSLHLVACERTVNGNEQVGNNSVGTSDEIKESGFSVSFLFDTTAPCRIRVLLSASVTTNAPPPSTDPASSQTTPPFTDANGAPHPSLSRWWDFDAGFGQSFDVSDLFISRSELISAVEVYSKNNKLVPITVSLEALAPAQNEKAEVPVSFAQVHAARQDTMATCLEVSSLTFVVEAASDVAVDTPPRESGEEEKKAGVVASETKTERDRACTVQVPRLQVIMQRISIAGQVFELFELFGRTSSTAMSGASATTASLASAHNNTSNDSCDSERGDPSNNDNDQQQHRSKGTTSTQSTSFGPTDSEPECVICLSDPPSTILVPCRHVCLCQDCADQLSRNSDKCPVCRAVVHEILTLGPNPSRPEPTPGIGNASAAQHLPSGMAS